MLGVDHLGGGGDVEELGVGGDAVPHPGGDRPHAQVPGVKTIRPSGRVPVRGRSRSFCHFRMALVVAQLKWSSGS